MGYLKFERDQLINLDYSLSREIIRSNRAGSYISTTLCGCNTRKYHGLLVCPVKAFGGEKHVLLSTLDLTVVCKGTEFNLGIHRYQGGVYEPRGHKYLNDNQMDRVPKYTYKVGEVTLTMERLLVEKEEQLLIRYTVEDAPAGIKLRFRPFLAFRNIHHLSKANMYANSRYREAKNGISLRVYDNYPELYMQFSKKAEYVPVPDWYYNIEYQKELTRGYEYLEDLLVPGFFEVTLKKGETLVFSAATFEAKTNNLKTGFDAELTKRKPRENFRNTLENSAEQFISTRNGDTDIIAGFPWYDSITRQTFISLPGLSVCKNDAGLIPRVLNTYKKYLKDGMFPNQINTGIPVYNSADAPFWYIWAIQQYLKINPEKEGLWENYRECIAEIFNNLKKSKYGYVGLNKEGLVFAEKENTALTWMNSFANGCPVVQRAGYPIELNALWYNALCFSMDLASKAGDKSFVALWKGFPEKTATAFQKSFFIPGHEYPADVVRGKSADWAIRPNMVIAAAMEYSPITLEQKNIILNVARQKLLTPRGLRSLSPDHIRYFGSVEGNPGEREQAIHQGAVWPWLVQFFVQAWINVHGSLEITFLKQIVESFEEEMTIHSIGTMSEMYNGNPPHKAKGAVSQAWNVASVVYSDYLTDKITSEKKQKRK
jgi:predicted glycogen debranching enzyme